MSYVPRLHRLKLFFNNLFLKDEKTSNGKKIEIGKTNSVYRQASEDDLSITKQKSVPFPRPPYGMC